MHTYRKHMLLLSSLLLISACNPTVPVTGQATESTSLSSDIRPGTKGQRLELASLEGEMLIPAGTSSFVIQSLDYAVAQAPALAWLMPAAQAEEVGVQGDAPIDLEQLSTLQATVDGEEVDVEILKIEEQENGDNLVFYRLKKVPVTDDNAIVEFFSPSGTFKMNAIVPRIAQNMRHLDQRLSPDSTALVEYVKNLGKVDKPKGLTHDEIEHLQKTDLVQNIRNQIYDMYIQPPQTRNPPRFNDELKRRIDRLPVPQEHKDYIDKARVCFQSPQKCGTRPALPPRSEQPIPQAIRAEVARRLEVRQRVVNYAGPVDYSGTTPRRLSLEEIQSLQNLGPIQRRAVCIQKFIRPCPGL